MCFAAQIKSGSSKLNGLARNGANAATVINTSVQFGFSMHQSRITWNWLFPLLSPELAMPNARSNNRSLGKGSLPSKAVVQHPKIGKNDSSQCSAQSMPWPVQSVRSVLGL